MRTVIETAEAVRRGEVKAVEVLDECLTAIDKANEALNAFVHLDPELARREAERVDAAIAKGDDPGPLAGVPFGVKDLEDCAGLPTSHGSLLYKGRPPVTEDSIHVARLRAAGAVPVGKTAAPEFGAIAYTSTPAWGTTRNPWKLDRTPGGSSGGAAAAVAAGIGAIAHGSDGAGSIRIPAALCGVFGFKPSLGLVPYWPNPDFWAARSHNGPLARSVRDAALMLNAIAGWDSRDPVSLDLPRRDWLAACEPGDLKGLRVAWSPDFGYAAVDPEVRRVTTAAAARFAELGCSVEEVVPGWEDPSAWAVLLWDFQLAARNHERARQRPEWIEHSLRDMIEHGHQASSEDLGRAQLARTAFYEQARAFMQPYDLLLTPQMPCVAWSLDAWPATIGGRPTPTMFDHLPFTYPFNLTGWPAASLPCGFNSDGLPIALQVVAGLHQDALCLRAAAAFEALQPWADRHPDLDSPGEYAAPSFV